MTDSILPRPVPTQTPRTALYLGGGAALLAVGAMAATLALRLPTPDAKPQAAAATTAGATAPTAKAGHASVARAQNATPSGESATSPLATQPAAAPAVCEHCGTVESVQAVQKKGEGTGLGAVAGGVLGGAIGNQMGKGKGRSAMTVLGAVGGGLAGNEIEKRQRATTVYKVTVRMDDGSTRTLTRAESWAVGRRVSVDGEALRSLKSSAPEGAAPRMLQTGAPA